MPESVKDRPTKSHEYILILTKKPTYFWDAEAVKEPAVRVGDVQTFGGEKARSGTIEPTDPRFRGGHEQWGRVHTQDAGRNIRSVWTIATAPFSEAHFATFPPALAERCIKAGTSEKGACGACGAPWVRQTSERPYPAELANAKKAHGGIGNNLGGQRHQDWLAENPKVTTGWQPSCACNAPTVPCVVLDPFAGAGTVSLVAERLGRDSIYIDLSPEYAAMAETRIRGECPMFTTITTEKVTRP
jgi:hypothetical protein